MASTPYILVLYYTRYGATRELAEIIARGVESTGHFEACCRTVPDINTDLTVDSSAVPEDGPLLVSLADLKEASGLAMGSPTRFGNMAAPLKHFIDSTVPLWLDASLDGKPASVFTSTSSMHGGQESTLLSMMLPLMHHGMVIVGSSYTMPEVSSTRTGGTPYGPSHLAGPKGELPISEDEKKLAFAQGKRLAEVAERLSSAE